MPVTPDAVDMYHLHGAPLAAIIDREHAEIKRRQKNLRTAIVEGMGMDQIVACGKDLVDTTLEHFKSEEHAMEITGSPGLGMHKCLHDTMIKSLMEIWSDLEHRKIHDATELLRFFDERLALHLEWEDGAFGRELAGQK